MKIIIRTLIILAAALVVVGATMAYAASSGANTQAGFGDHAGFERQPPPGFNPGSMGARPEGFGGRREGFGERGGFDDHHRGDRGVFAAGELVKNLVIIAVIIAVFSLLSRLTRGLRPKRR